VGNYHPDSGAAPNATEETVHLRLSGLPETLIRGSHTTVALARIPNKLQLAVPRPLPQGTPSQHAVTRSAAGPGYDLDLHLAIGRHDVWTVRLSPPGISNSARADTDAAPAKTVPRDHNHHHDTATAGGGSIFKSSSSSSNYNSQRTTSLDFGWRFHLGQPTGASNSSVASPDFDDSGWRNLTLPHDFVIEGNFTKPRQGDPTKREGHGDLAHGFLPSGVGWYRRVLHWPADGGGDGGGAAAAARDGYITFDGVFRRASVYLNGKLLAYHRSGYTSFEVHLAGAVQPGLNHLAVRCDASVGEGWWYRLHVIIITIRNIMD
jgi:hypothetical protein